MCSFPQLVFPASRNLLLRNFLRQRWCLCSTAPTTLSDCFVCKLLASPKFCVCVRGTPRAPRLQTKWICYCSQNTNLLCISLSPPTPDWGTFWRVLHKSLQEISVILWGCLIGIKLQELLGRQWAESCLPGHQSLESAHSLWPLLDITLAWTRWSELPNKRNSKIMHNCKFVTKLGLNQLHFFPKPWEPRSQTAAVEEQLHKGSFGL